MGVWGLAPRKRFGATLSRASKNVLFSKLNILLFIMNLLPKEENFAVDKSDALYVTSVNYWGQCPMPPVSTDMTAFEKPSNSGSLMFKSIAFYLFTP